ncbi:MAG: OmpH family outer membrane protein [Flavisolibacter sp.]
MKNASLILNIVLLLAVGALYYMHFGKKATATVASKTSGKQDGTVENSACQIAYFDMDSLTNSYAMIKDVRDELSKEEDNINREMSRLQKSYNDKLTQYQKQAQTMSQVESERANRDMLQMQEKIRGKQQELEQRYQDLQMRKKQDIKNRIEDYLKDYNQSKRYSYIISYEPGMIFYRDTMLDITKDLLEGLNERYKKK